MAHLIAKITERCNSNCAYCDVVRKEGTGKTMSLDLLECMFARIDEYLRALPAETIRVIWHGGEPLLVGADYYRKIVEIVARCCPTTRSRIEHSLQTNLTLYSEEFVPSLQALGIKSVGTSFDPEPHMRGPGPTRDTAWYNERFLKALALLKEHGLDWGMIYVVTKRSLRDPEKLFYFLTNMNPRGAIALHPVLIYDDERTDIAVTPEEYVEFLGAVFPIWWAHRERYGGVDPFRSLVETIIHRNPSLGCVYSGTCTYDHVNVGPDGKTSQCGRSSDWGLLDYGHIADRPLDEILHDEQRAQLAERRERLPQTDCKGCRFWALCHGGCPLDAWSRHDSFQHKNEWCEERRGFIRKYFGPVTGVRYEPGACPDPTR